eukprot:7142795-Prymnesium_polylepis.1
MVATEMYKSNIPWPFNGFATARMLTPEEGARTSLFAALIPVTALACSSAYFDGCRCRAPSNYATDQELQHRMWTFSTRAISAFASPLPNLQRGGAAPNPKAAGKLDSRPPSSRVHGTAASPCRTGYSLISPGTLDL